MGRISDLMHQPRARMEQGSNHARKLPTLPYLEPALLPLTLLSLHNQNSRTTLQSCWLYEVMAARRRLVAGTAMEHGNLTTPLSPTLKAALLRVSRHILPRTTTWQAYQPSEALQGIMMPLPWHCDTWEANVACSCCHPEAGLLEEQGRASAGIIDCSFASNPSTAE